MSNRTIFYMTFTVIAGILVILGINAAQAFGSFRPKYLAPNDVRGMAIEHNKLLYTLNFEQQNALLEILNHSIPIDSKIPQEDQSKTPLEFERLVIYLFEGPDIEIKPVGYFKKASPIDGTMLDLLVFSAPKWNPRGLMQETTLEDFKKLISNTYDP